MADSTPLFERETIRLHEAATVLGMSYIQARRLANQGRFPGAFQMGRRSMWRVSVIALEKFLEDPHDLIKDPEPTVVAGPV